MKITKILWDTDGEKVDLPTEVEAPEGIVTEEDISDWLSDEYGFCHKGFIIDPDDLISTAMDQDCETTADVMAELLMDENWTTWKMFEGLAGDYLNGNSDVRKGIDLAVSALTGWNMTSIAKKILEKTDEEMGGAA